MLARGLVCFDTCCGEQKEIGLLSASFHLVAGLVEIGLSLLGYSKLHKAICDITSSVNCYYTEQSVDTANTR